MPELLHILNSCMVKSVDETNSNMAEFVKGNQLNAELEKIFERAEEQLVIISPFIKLHSRFIDVLKSKIEDHKLKIIIVFGKNEDNLSKSFGKDDFDFLKDFPNIEIKHEPRLHAKYYANESAAILSSMNLYDFSHNNNIEFGILTKATLVGALTSNIMGNAFDREAFDYFGQVIDNSETLYKRTPVYKDEILGLRKKYTHSNLEIDKLSRELGNNVRQSSGSRSTQKTQSYRMGYCIRMGEQIPFNIERPLSNKAYQSWSKFGDDNYREKFCHFSGDPSNGETSFARPILRKNWNKARQ